MSSELFVTKNFTTPTVGSVGPSPIGPALGQTKELCLTSEGFIVSFKDVGSSERSL